LWKKKYGKWSSETAMIMTDRGRYDYDEDKCRLVVRMPTGTHERFIAKVEEDILTQLRAIRNGSGKEAQFAQKLHADRSTEILFPSLNKSKYEPDASYWHEDAEYPGVILEVAYSQKKKDLARLADNYICDSDASVRAVVCLDIEYDNKESRKATLSVWRPQLIKTPEGLDLRAIRVVADEVGSILVTTLAIF
jgi:hypothetical protein